MVCHRLITLSSKSFQQFQIQTLLILTDEVCVDPQKDAQIRQCTLSH
jgi:hypothetical protein